MNEINIGEVYYVTARRRSPSRADAFLELLGSLPITPVGNRFGDVVEAAKIKARYPVSYADAFAVATALRMNAVIVTGDREILDLAPLVEVHRL